jgi:hypothetical protein
VRPFIIVETEQILTLEEALSQLYVGGGPISVAVLLF